MCIPLCPLFPQAFSCHVAYASLHPGTSLMDPALQILVRANCVDFWRLLWESGLHIESHFILYPNPCVDPGSYLCIHTRSVSILVEFVHSCARAKHAARADTPKRSSMRCGGTAPPVSLSCSTWGRLSRFGRAGGRIWRRWLWLWMKLSGLARCRYAPFLRGGGESASALAFEKCKPAPRVIRACLLCRVMTGGLAPG